MRYLDSGARDPSQTLGRWLQEVLSDDTVVDVRWQSGFFTADGLGFLAPTLDRVRAEGGTVAAVVGSNNSDTLRSDIARLARLIGIPRAGARLGIVSFAGAFFHPKTYHIARRDGSETAYVGSANLTSAGVGSLHVEAGVVLDSRSGDEARLLATIRAAVDAWFADGGRPGLSLVTGEESLARLTYEGVLAERRTPRARIETGAADVPSGSRPRLRMLVTVPPWGDVVGDNRESDTALADSNERSDDEIETIASSLSAIPWELVWRSNGLSERDLNIPTGGNTNPTGSIGLRKGDWHESIDHRHYFREEVFAGLQWSIDPRVATREIATAIFEITIDLDFKGEAALKISHNTNTSSKTYQQRNEMTHLRWGEAKTWVADRTLLGAILSLYRERNPQGVPRFRISIDRGYTGEGITQAQLQHE